jgi:hypothetical protein
VRERARALLGPVVIGLAVWCAAGSISVASPAASSVRLALPAAWWIFVVAVAAAALVPAWRRDFKLTLPALLATLPWWPLPMPAVALIWTGPLGWAPIALTVGALVCPPVLSLVGGLRLAGDCRRGHWLAGAATLFIAALAAWSAAPRVPGGDEPHYMAIAHSLLKDGDLRIENNHQDPAFIAAFGALKPDSIARGRDHQLYSIHAPGLAVLVLPAYAALGYFGAQATVLFLAALAGSFVWRIGWRAAKDTNAAWFAWAAVVGSCTFLFQSFTIFPDGPAALIVAAGVLVILKLADEPAAIKTRSLVVTSAMLAYLPWLHTRLAVIAAGLGLIIVWRLASDRSRPAVARWTRVATFLALPIVSAIGWLAFFQIIYGTPNPTAPYGPNPEGALRNSPGGLVAILFDGQFGLLMYSPVLMTAGLGLWRAADRSRRNLGLALGAVALAYLAAVTTVWMWWAGRPAPPARFTTAILPVFALLLAHAWSAASAVGRRRMLALLGASLTITALVVGVDHAGLGWNDRDGAARWLDWLGPVVNLPRGWPSFFWSLDVANLRTEIPFAIHAAIWVSVFVAAWLALHLVSRRASIQASRAAVAGWLAISLMLAVQAGWLLNQSNGLDPARSQLALLGAERGSRSIVRVSSFGWASLSDPAGAMTIQSERRAVSVTGAARPLLALADVPAGTYELKFEMTEPHAARALVSVGRSVRPLRVVELLPLAEQSHVLALPVGALLLTVASDPTARAAATRVEVVPVSVQPGPRTAFTAVRYGASDVFFLDNEVFVEAEGFWVRGNATAEVVMVAPGQGGISLLVRNGAVANAVVLDVGGRAQTYSLRPSEERVVDLPVGDQTGTVRLRVISPAGFRPSDSPTGDRRLLGVWIQPRQ